MNQTYTFLSNFVFRSCMSGMVDLDVKLLHNRGDDLNSSVCVCVCVCVCVGSAVVFLSSVRKDDHTTPSRPS